MMIKSMRVVIRLSMLAVSSSVKPIKDSGRTTSCSPTGAATEPANSSCSDFSLSSKRVGGGGWFVVVEVIVDVCRLRCERFRSPVGPTNESCGEVYIWSPRASLASRDYPRGTVGLRRTTSRMARTIGETCSNRHMQHAARRFATRFISVIAPYGAPIRPGINADDGKYRPQPRGD